MKQIFLIGLLLLLPATLKIAAQTQNVDSLVKVLETGKLNPIDQLNVYLKICTFYSHYDNEKLLHYAKKAIIIAEKEEDKSWASRFNMIFGQQYAMKNNYDSAMIYYNKAISFAKQSNSLDLQGGAYMMIGDMYLSQSQYDTALDYYFKALPCLEFSNKRKYGLTLEQIGQLYRGRHDLDKAIEYLDQAKVIAETVNSPDLKMGTYYNLGSVYRMKNERDSAIVYALKTLTISTENHNKEYEILSACLASLTYIELSNYGKALEFAQQAVKTSKEYGDSSLIIAAMDALSRVYLEQKNYVECNTLARKAWEMDTLNYGPTGYNIVARLLFTNVQLGKAEDAMYFFDKLNKILDHDYDERMQSNINGLEVKYETQKKEMRITSLEKERRLYSWLGITGALLAVSLGVVLWQKNRNAQKEKQLIAAQSIQDGELNERARLAEDLHDRLGGSLSAVKIELQNAESLQNVGDKLDQCIKEVREITHNLMPRSLRLSGLKGALEDFTAQFPNVHFHFFGEEKRVRERLEFAIYCCANELITNSLRHSGAENINVQLVQSEKHLSLTVQDDGCGFDEATVKRGIGLKNIQDRVASYNGKLDIASAPGKGTETVIELRTMS